MQLAQHSERVGANHFELIVGQIEQRYLRQTQQRRVR